LTIPWIGFFLLIWSSYVTINILFAFAYWLGGNCIANAKPGSFLDAFFFSVQTLASIVQWILKKVKLTKVRIKILKTVM
jgi:inward rectifier potassium channel